MRTARIGESGQRRDLTNILAWVENVVTPTLQEKGPLCKGECIVSNPGRPLGRSYAICTEQDGKNEAFFS